MRFLPNQKKTPFQLRFYLGICLGTLSILAFKIKPVPETKIAPGSSCFAEASECLKAEKKHGDPVMLCLMKKYTTLPPACQKTVEVRMGGGPCWEDAKELCPKKELNFGMLQSCLHRNLEKTSIACAKNLMWQKRILQKLTVSCADEHQKYCPEAKAEDLLFCHSMIRQQRLMGDACLKIDNELVKEYKKFFP